MRHTFGTGEALASRVALVAELNRLRARQGRYVPASLVAKRLSVRGTITGAEVLAVAAAQSAFITVNASNLTLTDLGLRAARARMTPRYLVV